MAYRTMTIAISDEEMQALNRLAMAHYRRPRDQVRYILRQVLIGDQSEEKHNGAAPTLPGANAATVVSLPG